MKESLIILIPVYNDLASLETLISNLESVLADVPGREYSLLIVNDGSTKSIRIPTSNLFTINILHLHRNTGHQKAIAIGMAHIHHNMSCTNTIVMDGDGEDRPEDILTLLKTLTENPGQIIFARRKARQEGFRFRLFYFSYKLLFRWLTGKKIAFGNFMVIPKDKLDKLVYHSEIWNHLSAAIIKSRIAFSSIPVNRGKRYAEDSKMSFTSLVLHGLEAIAVFLEQVVSRLLILSFALIVISTITILLIIGIRIFTDLAIPGWASTILSSLLIVLLQGFLLSLFTIFLFLSSQSQRKFIPAHHYKDYIAETETIQHAS
ncbi:MAG: glycosyltransferase [Bacteroidota bacterium]|nr:glycosyltransferase [Bacteroidota bacterium]